MIEFEREKDNLQDFLLYIIKEFIIILKLMKNKSIVIICGDPKSTFNEILIKTLKNKVFKKYKISNYYNLLKKIISK